MRPSEYQLLHAQADRRAAQVIDDYGISSLPVDPFQIAERAKIFVRVDDSPRDGASGCMMKMGDAFGIMVFSKALNNDGYKRFTLAHELGHYFLDGHVEALFADRDEHRSRAGFVSADPFEREADHFAACLLMPRSLIMPIIRRTEPGLGAVKRLAAQCQTSLTACAITYSAHTEHPVAVIVSEGRNIDYCFCSPAFGDLRGFRPLPKGALVPSASATGMLNNEGCNDRQRDSAVELDLWFDSLKAPDGYEEAVVLGRYGKTLTILSIGDDECGEEDDENDMDD